MSHGRLHRQETPEERGGIRMCNDKFMFVNYEDPNKVVQLSKPKGWRSHCLLKHLAL